MPTFSIITATYNAEKFMARAMASIMGQTYGSFEWIIQDGGSTDATVAIVQRSSDKRIKLVSEPDTGVYDAWNKAVARASGGWYIFLGGDDCLLTKDTLLQCAEHLAAMPEHVEFAYGALVVGTKGDNMMLMNNSVFGAYHGFLANMGIPFPATFIRGSLLQKERFDTKYKIAGDYEFAARLVTRKNLARIPRIVSYMERGGLSGNPRDERLLNERLRILHTAILPRSAEFVHGEMLYLKHPEAVLQMPKDGERLF